MKNAKKPDAYSETVKEKRPDAYSETVKEKRLDTFSEAVKEKKESLYDRVTLGEKQLTVIIRIVSVLLGIVVVLIILEAAGIFKL